MKVRNENAARGGNLYAALYFQSSLRAGDSTINSGRGSFDAPRRAGRDGVGVFAGGLNYE
jgi:hypothetical protein